HGGPVRAGEDGHRDDGNHRSPSGPRIPELGVSDWGPRTGSDRGQTVARRTVARPPASRATASTASSPVSPAAVRPLKKWPTPAQPCAQMGRRAVELLLERMADPSA